MKRVVILVIVMVLLLTMAAFTEGKQEKGPVTLTFWFPAGAITATSMPFRDGSRPWTSFEAENNVRINVIAVNYETMKQKLLTSLAGGKAPDIAMVDSSWMGAFVKDNALVPIASDDAKKWLDGVSPDTRELSDWGGGKMYGYPNWGEDAYALTWNVDMFREAGLDPYKAPAYLAEFREYSKKLTVREGGELKRVGYAIRHVGEPNGIVDKWDWLLVSSGVKYVDPPTVLTGGRSIIDIPPVRKALQSAHDMLYVDKSTSLKFPDPRECLLKGLAAMQISELVSIQVRQPREAPNLKWAFAPPPAAEKGGKPAVHISAWNFSVLSPSRNKELALKAIKWYTNKENDFNMAKKYRSTPRWMENYNKEPFLSDPFVKQFKSLLPYGQPYPKNLALPGIMEGIGAAIQKIMQNTVSVEDALKGAQKKADAAIEATK